MFQLCIGQRATEIAIVLHWVPKLVLIMARDDRGGPEDAARHAPGKEKTEVTGDKKGAETDEEGVRKGY